MGVRVEFEFKETEARIKGNIKKGQGALSLQALIDSNRYVKKDAGILEASSIKASDPETGELVWDVPYAKKQYYTGNPSKDINPQASKMWAHRAFSIHGKQWLKLLQKIVDRG